MAFFIYREGQLYAENVPLDKIAEQIQTPLYCYSASALRQNYRSYSKHFNAENSLICFAVKANSNQPTSPSSLRWAKWARVPMLSRKVN